MIMFDIENITGPTQIYLYIPQIGRIIFAGNEPIVVNTVPMIKYLCYSFSIKESTLYCLSTCNRFPEKVNTNHTIQI